MYTVLRVLTNAYNYVVDREQFFAPPNSLLSLSRQFHSQPLAVTNLICFLTLVLPFPQYHINGCLSIDKYVIYLLWNLTLHLMWCIWGSPIWLHKIPMENKLVKRSSTLLVIRKMPIKTMMRYHHTSVRMTKRIRHSTKSYQGCRAMETHALLMGR